MDLREAIRTTGSAREFRDEPVSDELVSSVLDDARFAPSGGNRQPWRVVLVKDEVDERTVTTARPIEGAERLEELAAMLDGLPPTPESRANAAATTGVVVECDGGFSVRGMPPPPSTP